MCSTTPTLRSLRPAKTAQDIDGDGKADVLGDWDGDGVPDLGTEDGLYSAWGISLGGIVTAVLAGIEPKLSAAVPQSGGGGLSDIAMRSLQAGVPQMVLYGNWGPLVMGRPVDGGTALEWMAPHFERVDLKRFAVIPTAKPGDEVTVRNLRTGDTGRGVVNADGAFRVGVQADAVLPSEAAALFGRASGAGPAIPVASEAWGDPVEVCVAEICVKRFEESVDWVGFRFEVGQPLVALTRGLGRDRQTPDFRRFTGIAQAVLDAADPINYARHYQTEPLAFDYDPGVTPGCNVLDVLTIGDPNVPVATGVNLARAAGLVTDEAMESLIRNGVVEGNWRLGRFRTDGSGPHAFDPLFDWRKRGDEAILFDPDDLDEGKDGTGAPAPVAPYRSTVNTPDGGKAGLRILYLNKHGSHGMLPPDPTAQFPTEQWGINMVTRYLVTGGQELFEGHCLADNSCEFIPPLPGSASDE